MMKETNNMALVTSKVVVKMNKLEEKLDQQVAELKRQSESFRVHYAYPFVPKLTHKNPV